MLDDVLVVLQRAEMTTRMAEEIERDCVELGSEGRLIRMQLEELIGEVPARRRPSSRDYQAADDAGRCARSSLRSRRSPTRSCSSSRCSPSCSATARVNPLDHAVAPRGYRALSHIPRLPDGVIGASCPGWTGSRRSCGQPARARGGRGRRRGPGARDPRGPPAAPGAQPRRSSDRYGNLVRRAPASPPERRATLVRTRPRCGRVGRRPPRDRQGVRAVSVPKCRKAWIGHFQSFRYTDRGSPANEAGAFS